MKNDVEKRMVNLKLEFIEYSKKDREGKIEVKISEKKEVLVNGVKVKKLSELLGNMNIVIFTPEDMEILRDGPQKRRRFLDN